MGFNSPWQLLLILLIVILLFGTKRLKGIGGDLGEAIKSFRKSVNQDEDKKPSVESRTSETLDVQAEKRQESQHKD